MSRNALAQIQARNRQQPVTWDEVRRKLAAHGESMGEWAGMPMPAKGMSMTIHPSYPFAKNLARTFMPEPVEWKCSASDVREDVALRNSWNSYRDHKRVEVWQVGKKIFSSWAPTAHTGTMLIDTIGAARSWDPAAEERAQETLRRHVTKWQFESYQMTGQFLETSKRSGVIYMFRRSRPTVAMSGRPDYRRGEKEESVRILCTLCLHPIGFYDGTWAGALVPTDDVISHLLLMRGDEHLFWKQANHHHPLQPESGL